jgi:transcriptional regulator with AAA-type ATPase domain/tetratricopeptide (TPR) repeat protein
VDPLDQLLGTNRAFAALKARARQLLEATRRARRRPPVLLQGEVGTGKNLLARALHQASGRAAGPFVHVQCNAIPETLAETLLFGHERGVFTGADRSRPGYFRTAHQGTILLDEIGTLSDAMQAQLLQVVDEGLVPVVGLSTVVPVDVWVICATNVDLGAAVRDRRFRADLLSRLTVRFTLPPLRERRSDIVPLAEKFLSQACADFGLPAKKLSPAARAHLERDPWPENARGLRNMIENAVIFTPGPVIDTEHLEITAPTAADDVREHYLEVLESTGWNISRASQALAVTRQTLRARIARWELKDLSAQRQAGRKTSAAAPGDARMVEPAEIITAGGNGPARPDDEDDSAGDESPRSETRADSRGMRWERRWLGFLRFSLTGPDLEDTAVRARPYLDHALERLRHFGGQVVELWPTGVDAAFGLDAIEGSAQRAASAALAIQVVATRANQETTGAPQWRIALHAMSCLVGSLGLVPQIDRDARRHAADVMDTLVAASEPGTVLASAEVGPFLRRRFSLGPNLGPGLAGSARPVLGPLLQPGGFGEHPGPFVGRRGEIETLQGRRSLAGEGRGQIVGIVGDPGVGKSRLVWEFAHAGPDSGWLVLDTASVALGRPTPFLAAIALLRTYFDLAAGEAEDSVRDKVIRRVTSLDPALLPSLPAFLTLLDVAVDDPDWQMLDPAQRGRQMLAGIKRLLLEESTRQPLLLVFEDAHWADAKTRELLDELADSVPVAPILMLVTYRPEHQHAWGGRSFYTQVRVEPLRGESAERLAEDLLGADPSLAKLRVRLIEWTDGNPFFIEEVVRTLAETGVLRGDRGAYRLVRTVDAIVVPGTVEEVLASRIARLGAGPSELLRAAAVVGSQVSYAVLAAVSGDRPEMLETHLRILQAGEFLYQAGEGPEREYTFRHALTQEVAYTSLTADERRSLHARAMEAMALVYEAREDEKIDELAHHAFEGRVWPRAAEYLRRAGRRDFARSANRQAVDRFSRALTALSHLPPSRGRQEEAIDVRLDLRSALWPLGELDSMGKVLSEAHDLAEQLGDARRIGHVAVTRCHYFFLVSRHHEAAAAGEAALVVARKIGHRVLERDAMLYGGLVQGALGNYRRAVERLTALLEAYATAGTALAARERVVSLPTARTYAARYLAELGELRPASEHATAGLKAAEIGGTPWLLATCYFGMASVEVRRGDFPAAITWLESSLELCHSHHLESWFPSVAASLGHAYANAGRPAEGLALLEKGIAHADRIHLAASSSMWLTYLGEAYLRLGRLAEAGQSVATSLDRARKHGERGHEAWALFLLASIAGSTEASSVEEIEHAFGAAIELARMLDMRPLLAHCHAALAEVHYRRGRPERAVEEHGRAQRLREEIGMLSPTTSSAGA